TLAKIRCDPLLGGKPSGTVLECDRFPAWPVGSRMRKRLPWMLFVLACAVGIGVYNPFLLVELILWGLPLYLGTRIGLRWASNYTASRASPADWAAPDRSWGAIALALLGPLLAFCVTLVVLHIVMGVFNQSRSAADAMIA